MRAVNVNTIDEVPDSSWFTNRARPSAVGRSTALVKGAGHRHGPVGHVDDRLGQDGRRRAGLHDSRRLGPALFHQVRSAVESGDGERRRGHLDEVLLRLRLSRARELHRDGAPRGAGRSARTRAVEDDNGRRRQMEPARHRRACSKRAARNGDGSYRVLASKALEGKPVGPFRYYGTRPDDPNDIFPHEHRRELRGLLVVLRLAEPRRLAQHQQPRYARRRRPAARSSAIICSTSDRRSAAARRRRRARAPATSSSGSRGRRSSRC